MWKNSLKTAVLLAALGDLFLGIGAPFGGQAGLTIGLLLGLVFVGGSYWFSDKLAVRSAGAQPVTEAEAPALYAIVRDLTSRADMPMPAVYTIRDGAAAGPGLDASAALTGRSSRRPAGEP